MGLDPQTFMNKEEAVKSFVKELNSIPQSWVEKVMEATGEYHTLPMWGTMWFIDWDLEKHTKMMLPENFGDDFTSEMEGELAVVDSSGNPTGIYYYEINDDQLIGVNGAGWDFYKGIWDELYDILGLQWHSDSK